MEQTLVIQGVNARTTKTGKSVYEVQTDAHSEPFVTFEPAVAEQAKALIGSRVNAEVNTVQNGAYTNRYFNAVNGILDAAPEASQTSQAGVSQDERGRIMGRNNIAAHAVPALIAKTDGQPQTLNALLHGLAQWAETGEPAFNSSFVYTPAADGPPPKTDDDIPF